jgi:filamentous hemagglutinin
MGEPLEISISSDKANADHINAGEKPPYGGARARDVILKNDTVFVRVHGEDNQASSWMMRAEDIEGLTAKQIKEKFALPELPKYISEVHVPKGTRIFIGKVAPQKGWGKGGGIQYELKGDRLPLSTWKNRKPIK